MEAEECVVGAVGRGRPPLQKQILLVFPPLEDLPVAISADDLAGDYSFHGNRSIH